jgi:3-hydroxyacyl-[acyl-carrier-protein] dehydratase
MKKKINDKIKILKIKEPFLMLDKVTNFKKNKSCVGHKKVKLNDWFFKSHFIDEPTMPGTLQIEAMLQTTVYLIYKSLNKTNERCIISNISTRLLNRINKTGNLKIYSKIIKIKKGTIQCESFIIFDRKMTCSGKFFFIIPSKFKI